MTILVGFLGGMLGEVLCKDVGGLGFSKTSASGGAQNLGQFCALGWSPNLLGASNGQRQNESKGLLPQVFQEPLVEARLADQKRMGHFFFLGGASAPFPPLRGRSGSS